jgi:rod shape determining protein RodA
LRQQNNILQHIDWMMVTIYLLMVGIGWMSIYAAVYNDEHTSILDMSQNYGKQALWIVGAIVIALCILIIDGKFYAAFSYPIYLFFLLALVVVLAVARDVKGAVAWIDIGNFKLQPSEFAKFATAMALAKFLSAMDIKMQNFKTKIISFLIIVIPAALILKQNDTGSALVYASFIFVMYREGLSGNILILIFIAALLFVLTLLVPKVILFSVIIGMGLLVFFMARKKRQNIFIILAGVALCCIVVFSVDYAFNNVLQEHQRTRIEVLLGKEIDLKGAGYNVNQSKIAIGSGGLLGKGFLQGTQTKFSFVPEQSTDFIFCTVGEEWGFLGSLVIIGLFMLLLGRILFVAERQRSPFTRIYGYGVASILFFHLMVNIGMTIGLAPVIGIPLPFFSYGGSSLWSFTILLFIFIKLDAYRLQILR